MFFDRLITFLGMVFLCVSGALAQGGDADQPQRTLSLTQIASLDERILAVGSGSAGQELLVVTRSAVRVFPVNEDRRPPITPDDTHTVPMPMDFGPRARVEAIILGYGGDEHGTLIAVLDWTTGTSTNNRYDGYVFRLHLINQRGQLLTRWVSAPGVGTRGEGIALEAPRPDGAGDGQRTFAIIFPDQLGGISIVVDGDSARVEPVGPVTWPFSWGDVKGIKLSAIGGRRDSMLLTGTGGTWSVLTLKADGRIEQSETRSLGRNYYTAKVACIIEIDDQGDERPEVNLLCRAGDGLQVPERVALVKLSLEDGQVVGRTTHLRGEQTKVWPELHKSLGARHAEAIASTPTGLVGVALQSGIKPIRLQPGGPQSSAQVSISRDADGVPWTQRLPNDEFVGLKWTVKPHFLQVGASSRWAVAVAWGGQLSIIEEH